MRKVRTWIGGTPAILEGIEKEAMEKFGARFCVAQTLTIPKEGNMTVHQGNFSEKSITLKPGKGQFLDPIQESLWIQVLLRTIRLSSQIKVIKDQRLSWMNLCGR